MSDVHSLRSRESIRVEASGWIARLEADDVSEADRRALQEWLSASSANRSAFEAMRRTWHRLDALGCLASDVPIQPQRRKVGTARLAGIAALLALLVTAGLQTFEFDTPLRYRTAVGHQSTISLPDGSSVQLNTDSAMEVQFMPRQRRIRLMRGEALFDVAPDAARPFVVQADRQFIRAIGTMFLVHLVRDGSVDVTVTEGIVEVAPDEPPAVAAGLSASAARLTANERLVAPSGGSPRVARVDPVELDRQLAWRRGMLQFDGEPLRSVVAEVERYTELEFEFADPALEEIRLGGYFRATDTEAFLALLHSAVQIESRRVGRRVILWRRPDTTITG